jgi:hypothetical protein
MFNRAPSLGRLTLALLCLAGLVGLFLVMRCRRDPNDVTGSATSPKQIVHLNVLNVSNCEWRVVIAPMAGGDKRTLKLPLGKSLEVELAAGEYEVEQMMAIADAGPDATRRFSMKLDAGEHYRWRLVTLLSDSAEVKGQP